MFYLSGVIHFFIDTISLCPRSTHITQKIFEETELSKDEIFLDIGHGIGNAPIQAAATVGCEARGIELVEDRFAISVSFRDSILEQVEHEKRKTQQVSVPL